MSGEILEKFKDNFNPDPEYHKSMYDKYFPIYKKEGIDADRLFSVSGEEELREVTYFAMYRAKLTVNSFIYLEPDFVDLKNLLDMDLERLPDLSQLSLTQGLSFCDHFTKKGRLSTPIAGKGNAQAINLLTDDYGLYKATLKAFYFHKKNVTSKAVLRTVELLVPVVSNFRPLSACKIWYDYAVKQALEEGRDYVALHVPSEGWLGRLLSSYKIAYDYQQLTVYYVSTDPNPIVNREGNRMIEMLRSYHNLENWKPILYMEGSENFDRVHPEMQKRGIKFDVSFTSPPYFNTEKYQRGYVFSLFGMETTLVKSEDEIVTVRAINSYEKDKELLASDVEQGMELLINGEYHRVTSISITGQSWDKNASQAEWRINFLLATYKCLSRIVKPGGHVITNIANVNTYMTLEADTVKSMKEAGLTYLREEFYKLSRKPSKNKESEITARKGEPVFFSLVPEE
jgi:hypothetical protein